jgi:hypothetical protein
MRRPKVCSVILHGIILLHMHLYTMEEFNRIIMHIDSCNVLLLYETEVFQLMVVMILAIICFSYIYSWDKHAYDIC